MKKYNVGIVGATGVVGKMILKLLIERDFPINEMKLFASSNSKGKVIRVENKEYVVEEILEDSFDNLDLLLFSAGSEVSHKYAKKAKEKGIYVIDNSSAFREDKTIPLVVPEINFEEVKKEDYLISNPNCSTIQSVIPLNVLNDLYSIKRIDYTTYQSVSGAGYKGIKALEDNLELSGYIINNNCIPLIGDIDISGYSTEELKMINETKKILSLKDIEVSSTCTRVPIMNSHAVSITIKCEKETCGRTFKDKLIEYKSVRLYDTFDDKLPSHIESNGEDIVTVGRVKKDLFDKKIIHFYCTADNIRRGAATNSVEIAFKIIEKGWI